MGRGCTSSPWWSPAKISTALYGEVPCFSDPRRRSGKLPGRCIDNAPRQLQSDRALRFYSRVLIAPTRGNNSLLASISKQRRWSSSPLRGVTTGSTSSCCATSRPVLIAPTRGHNEILANRRGYPDGSSSPLRGVTTRSPRCRPRTPPASSSPLRGVTTTAACSRTLGPPGPHRPYEGSQPPVIEPGEIVLVSYRPYEGSQRELSSGSGARTSRSSSPLRGVTTGSRSCAAP